MNFSADTDGNWTISGPDYVLQAGQGDGAPGAGRRLAAADPLNDFDRRCWLWQRSTDISN